MTRKKIFIWGSSSHAQCIVNILEKEDKYSLAFLFDPTLESDTEILGYPVYRSLKEISEIVEKNNIYGFLIGIGDNYIRRKVYASISTQFPHLEFVNAVHPSANIEKNVFLGKGTVIMGGAFIETCSKVGKGSWIGVNASLGYNNQVGHFSSVAVNSCIGGNVVIGDLTAITMCVTVLQKLIIGNSVVVGSSSLVTKSVNDGVVVYGSPAKVIRKRSEDGKYL